MVSSVFTVAASPTCTEHFGPGGVRGPAWMGRENPARIRLSTRAAKQGIAASYGAGLRGAIYCRDDSTAHICEMSGAHPATPPATSADPTSAVSSRLAARVCL